MRGYINGVFVPPNSSGAPSAGSAVSGLNIDIANRRSDGARQFAGLIEDVRIYSRILSTGEILQYHNGTLSLSDTSGLIYYWEGLPQTSASGAFAATGYDNTGPLVASPLSPVGSIVVPQIGTWPVTRYLQNYLTANTGLFFDASGTLPLNPTVTSGGLVGQWFNRTTCSYNSTFSSAREAIQTTSARRPTAYKLYNGQYAVEFTNGSSHHLLYPYGTAAPTPLFTQNKYSIIVLARSKRLGDGDTHTFMSRSNLCTFHTDTNTNLAGYGAASNLQGANSLTMYALVMGPTGMVIYRDSDVFTSGVVNTSGFRGSGYLGANSALTSYFDGQIQVLAEYQAVLSPSEISSIWSYLKTNYNITEKTRTVIELGSSSMEGVAASGMAERTYLMNNDPLFSQYRFINFGVGGYTTNQTKAQTGFIQAVVATERLFGRSDPMIIEQIGSNDLYVSSDSAATVYASWTGLVNSIKNITTGPYFQMTILPRSGVAGASGQRPLLNDLRLAYPGIYHINAAADPVFAEGAQNSGLWYADTVHLSSTGFKREFESWIKPSFVSYFSSLNGNGSIMLRRRFLFD